jgi:restriction endonuclease S subunit
MKLEEISEVKSGSLLDRSGSAALYIQLGDISPGSLRMSRLTPGAAPPKSMTAAALKKGNIVVALRGNVNAAAVVPSLDSIELPVFATLDVAIIRIHSVEEPEYIAWFLNLPSTQETLSSERSGSAISRLPLPALRQLDVPTPNCARQNRIVAIAAEMRHEQELIEQIQVARKRLINEQLRRWAVMGDYQYGRH